MIGRVCSLIKMMVPERNRGLLWASKARVPSNANDADGYQSGCIWLNTAGAAGTCLWVNEGSVTVASWVATDMSAGDAAGTLTFDDDTEGPLIALETTDPTGDAYTHPFLITGAYASSCGKGIALSATNTRPVSFLFDNASAALGSADYRAVLSRVYLCSDVGNAVTLNALRGQIKLADDKDISHASSAVAPVQGYFEFAGTAARTLNGHVACVRAALEEGASGTTTIGTYLAGFEATLNSTRTYAGAGLLAGFLVNIHGGTSKWQHGLYIDPTSATVGITLGAEAFATAGSGLPVDGVTLHSGCEFYFDDGGVKLAAGYTEAFRAGYLISIAITDADVSCYTSHDYIYIAADVETSGGIGATWASLLVKTGMTITTSAGVCDFSAFNASVDVPSGATIGAGTFACGIACGGNLGGAHTGKAVCLRARTPSAGAWDGLFAVETGLYVETHDASADVAGSIPICVNGAVVYLQYWPNATT